MFKLLEIFHFYVAGRLLNVSIGVRLFALMGLAASASLLLAATGILGLAASKDSLRTVYEERMLPLQHLADIARLMLTNRLLLQTTLSEVHIDTGSAQRPLLQLDRQLATQTAEAIEQNIAQIDLQWQRYTAFAHTPPDQHALQRFATNRGIYIREALRPATEALRAGSYDATKTLAARAQDLYNKAIPDLQTLNQVQLEAAYTSYIAGVRRYENTRLVAVIALGCAMAVMTWLGMMLTTSIINPLKQVIAIFRRISNGQYDSAITIQGKDEISKVMRALGDMQTKLGQDEKAIHQLAFYDPLTNLPNRRLLHDRLLQALAASERNQRRGAVLMIDLDNFKRINDTRGHDIGDRLLAEVALRVQDNVRQADTVSRLGGDEFIIVLVDLAADETQATRLAEGIAEKILRALSEPFVLDDHTYHSTASIGLCLFNGLEVGIDDLLKRADISMYQAKTSGRNALRLYDPNIHASLESHAALESELREALALGQLRLFYQVQVDSRHGVLGAEVLLRWEHPRYGLMAPDQFIPIAEESGLILPIGEWVLQTACAQLRTWAEDPASEHFVLSVNVSARQFLEPDFVALVIRTLAETGVDPRKIKLELTESLVLHNVADTIEKMQALNQHGVHFSMDDFGTGYSSLAHLTELPIQQLKIDRRFVRHIATNYNDAVIVQTIIGMAHNLGVAVIAEGVETEAQRACLERFGCPTYQGYLFGKPMPLHQFEELALPVLTA